MSDQIVVACIPVALAAIHWPNYVEQSERLNKSTYQQVYCPLCGDTMWLGARSKELVLMGLEMLCAVCLAARTSPHLSRLEAQAHVASALTESMVRLAGQ